jgi:hypothetical protein
MNWAELKSRLGRVALILGLAGGMLGGVGAAAAQAAVGKDPGDLTLAPVSGPSSLTPSWSTTIGCAYGFQGSAVLRAVRPTGVPIAISVENTAVTAPFGGTLQASVSEILSTVIGVPDGGADELVVYCYSGPNLTGNSDPEMSTFIYLSADGTAYSTAYLPPVPVGEVGGLAFAGLAAIGLVWMQLRRRSRRRPG